MDHGAFRRVIDASDDAQIVVRCIRQVNHFVDTFVVCEFCAGIANAHVRPGGRHDPNRVGRCC